MQFQISPIDSNRFGVKAAKVFIEEGESVDQLMSESQAHGVQLLMIRTPAECSSVQAEIEAHGGFLADTLVYARADVRSVKLGELPFGMSIRAARSGDAADVGILSCRSFKGYVGHYHTDPRLKQDDADAAYGAWAESCVLGAAADNVFVVESATRIVAFAALKRLDDSNLDCVLCAVDAAFRGQGLLDALLRRSMVWAFENGFSTMEYSTHLANIAAQKAIGKLGFTPYKSVNTFHKWFDRV